MMDADEIERIINEELKKVDLSEEDFDDYEEEDLVLNLPEDDSNSETEGIPESVLTYFDAARDRMSVFEKHLQEDQEENNEASRTGSCVATCESEDLLKVLATSAGDNPIALKERIISELEEQLALPTALDHQVAVEDNAVSQNEPAVGEPDLYVESEQRLELEMEELERRLKEEEERKREAREAERRQHLLREKQEEERKRLRQEQFTEELKKIDQESQFQNTVVEEAEELIERKMDLELANQKEAIRRLEEEVKAERRAFEEAQEEQRRRQLEKEQQAATRIQAAVRAFLTRRWTKPALNRRREEERRKEEQRRMMEKERKEREERIRLEREEEEKRREEEEARQREEQERRRAVYEKAKQEERQRLERERKQEEEKRRREEEEMERKRKGEEERKRQEKEEEERKQKMEKERQQKLEQEKKRKEEEARRRQEEEQKKRKEEEDLKRREAEEQRREEVEEEEQKRIEWKKKKEIEEETRRKEEARKLEEERRVKAEEEKKTESVEGSRSLQEKNEEERERRTTESTQATVPQETEIRHAKPVEQRTAASSDDDQPETQHQHISSSTPDPSHVHQRRTSGHLDETSPAGATQSASQSGCTDAVMDAGSVCLPDHVEQKRLAWMLNCIPWSKLSVQNRRKGPVVGRKGPRRPTQPSLPPLSVDSVLQSGAWSSLTQVTTVTLEDLPGCSVSTLSACGQLQSLTFRRCGLTSLEGLGSCTRLRHIDVQENSIVYVDCGDLAQLQVLRLGRNQLTSIHGLDGAGDLTELQLSHNRISRIGGLEALKKLQSLWIDHNQLTSTRGLTEAFTLQHLDLSHNHVTRVEGLDNCALLRTLSLAGNTLMEAPSLRNHVLLGELSLEDNSISSLEALASCWLPLLHSLNLAQNSLTQLSPLPDFISLTTLDVSHNCLSELQSVCESVQQCSHLQQLKLTGNPLQQESSWRSSLLTAVPGLLLVDEEETGASLACPTSSPPDGSFQALCQAQRQQLLSLQHAQQAEISSAKSSLEAQLLFGNHTEALFQLAEEQRYAHEYGDTSITHGQPVPASSPPDAHTSSSLPPKGASGKAEPATKPRVQIPSPPPPQCQALGVGDLNSTNSACQRDQSTATCGPELARPVQKPRSSPPPPIPGPRHVKLDLRSVAAVVIQKYWRGYQCRMRKYLPEHPEAHGRRSPSVMSKIGVALPKSSDSDYAATVIQAVWRGHALRSRLHRALAAVATAAAAATAEEEHTGLGDEDLEKVDMDQFIFDEEAVERDWSLLGSDSVSLPPRESTEAVMLAYSERTPSPKPTLPPAVYHRRNPPVLLWKPKQAWGGSEASSASEMGIPYSSPSSKSPASIISGGGLSTRSEKILEEWGITDGHTAYLMLKRAQRMKSKKQQQKKLQDPTVRLALFRNHGAQEAVPTPVRGRAPPECRDNRKAPYAAEEEGEEQWESRGRRLAGRTYQWMHTQHVGLATNSPPNSGTPLTCSSERFLPEINPDVLSGGRVQLVTVPGYRDGLGPADLSHRETGIVRRHSVGHTRKEAPAPQRVTSAPSRKERISYRDKPVQLSGGWGGGKKRVRVCK